MNLKPMISVGAIACCAASPGLRAGHALLARLVALLLVLAPAASFADTVLRYEGPVVTLLNGDMRNPVVSEGKAYVRVRGNTVHLNLQNLDFAGGYSERPPAMPTGDNDHSMIISAWISDGRETYFLNRQRMRLSVSLLRSATGGRLLGAASIMVDIKPKDGSMKRQVRNGQLDRAAAAKTPPKWTVITEEDFGSENCDSVLDRDVVPAENFQGGYKQLKSNWCVLAIEQEILMSSPTALKLSLAANGYRDAQQCVLASSPKLDCCGADSSNLACNAAQSGYEPVQRFGITMHPASGDEYFIFAKAKLRKAISCQRRPVIVNLKQGGLTGPAHATMAYGYDESGVYLFDPDGPNGPGHPSGFFYVSNSDLEKPFHALGSFSLGAAGNLNFFNIATFEYPAEGVGAASPPAAPDPAR